MRHYIQLLILLMVFSTVGCGRKGKMETVSPTIFPIREAVFATGQMVANNQFIITASSDGYISQSLVSEGNIIQKGEVIFEQDAQQGYSQQAANFEQFSLAKKNASDESPVLKQLESQLEFAQQKLQNDETQLQRMQRLYSTQSVSKIDLENAQLAVNNSKSNVMVLLENIEATKITLEQNLISSKSQFVTSKINNSYFQIKSPGDFRVYQIYKKQGEYVRKAEPIALLGDSSDLMINLDIDESSIAKIELGQPVLVQLNTIKDEVFTAKITKIYPYFDEESQSFKVEARFQKMPQHLIAGTLLQANIIVAENENALLIPKNCLIDPNRVVLKTEQKADTVTVKTGIVSTEWVEILAGLEQSDKIYYQK